MNSMAHTGCSCITNVYRYILYRKYCKMPPFPSFGREGKYWPKSLRKTYERDKETLKTKEEER
jgi:hypothetical protein